MTRWKREFREWAAREKLAAWAMPRTPADWKIAKEASRIYDHIARTDDFKKRVHDAIVDDIFNNFPTTPVIAGGLGSLL